MKTTKNSMVSEIINATKWSETTKANNIIVAVNKNCRQRIEDIFRAFVTDKSNANYYAHLLVL